MKRVIGVAALAAILCAPVAADPITRPGDDADNIRYVLTITDGRRGDEASQKKINALALDDRPVRVMSGWRQPIVVVTTVDEAGGGPGKTSYQYQDVGITCRLQGRIVGDGRIRVSGELELSAPQHGEAGAFAGERAPRIEAFHYGFEVLLEDGAEVILAAVPGPQGGKLELLLSATTHR